MGKTREPDSRDLTAKYEEYKAKLAQWVRLFEEEHGHRPTESDKLDSKTWMALNDKTKFYKKLTTGSSGDLVGGDSRKTPTRRRGGNREDAGYSSVPHRR